MMDDKEQDELFCEEFIISSVMVGNCKNFINDFSAFSYVLRNGEKLKKLSNISAEEIEIAEKILHKYMTFNVNRAYCVVDNYSRKYDKEMENESK